MYLEVITDIYFVCMKCSFNAQLFGKVQSKYLGINEHKLIFQISLDSWPPNKPCSPATN